MKGGAIGEAAVIGANSVVISDIPLYCLAVGNPAEVYLQNYGRPSRNKSRTLYENSDFRDCGRKAQFRENGACSGGGRASFHVSVPVDSHGPALLI
jgi:carbonic anhydrase/acetyltransferase-like protein (isoleucine patch superfamily)